MVRLTIHSGHDLQDRLVIRGFPGLFLVGITRKPDKFLRPRNMLLTLPAWSLFITGNKNRIDIQSDWLRWYTTLESLIRPAYYRLN